MQKVICLNERKNNKVLEVGNSYYIDPMSIGGDADGDWYADVYRDEPEETWIGRFNLNHFRTA